MKNRMTLRRALRRPSRRLGRASLLSCWLAIGTGCAVLAVPEMPAPSAPVGIEWQESFLREHLRFFNGSESGGRGTASVGYARAAAYVGARMRQFGLQPGIHGDFRLVYQTPLNYPIASDLVAVGSDTLVLYPGVDFLPDARSDSGSAVFDRIFLLKDPENAPISDAGSERVALVEAASLTSAALAALRSAPFDAVLSMGALSPGTAARPVPGLLIQQITPPAAAALLGVKRIELAPQENPVRIFELPHEARMRVVNDFQEDAGAVNVLGFLAGKHPVRRQELVVVCADLDAVGSMGGVRTLDLQNLGTHAAALLELARNYGILSGYRSVPERTLLFAVFSGSRLGNAGLRAYLQNPLWELGKTVSMVYVGLPDHREQGVRNLLVPFDIPLFTVEPADDARYEQELVLVPEPATVRRARDRATQPSNEAVSLPELLDDAVARAQYLAKETHELLFPLTTGFGDGGAMPIIGLGTEK